MKTVDITFAGRTVALPDLPDYKKFYGKLGSGIWEPHTFEVLGANLDRDTVYLDIGAWIGVTPFWASYQAKRVIAVEPDPKCSGILEALAPAYPNVTLLRAALSSEPSVTIHAVDGFGSSETSILDIGDGESVTVPGISMRKLLEMAGDDPVFAKIDIEGYEFAALAELKALLRPNTRGVQLALHPQLLEKSLKGPKWWRRLRTAYAVWSLSRLFQGLFPPPTLAKYDGIANYILRGILLREVPKGADLVFVRTGKGS